MRLIQPKEYFKNSMSLKLTLNFFGGRSPSWVEEGCDVYLKRLSGSMEISVKEQGSAKVRKDLTTDTAKSKG